jgi:threonine dehydrogenase-like Zn-dependent dehydrogenase
LAILQRRGITTITESSHALGWFDVVVECSGNASGFDLARRLLRPQGTLVLKSTFHGVQELALAPAVIDEISVVGSRCGPFAPALRLLAEGLIDVDPLLEAEYPFERAAEAFRRAMTPGTLKVQLVMST